MLGWLALIIALLISALVFIPGDAAGLESVPGLTIAASVLALLLALYVAASARTHDGHGHGRTRTIVAVLVAAFTILAYALKDNATVASLLPKLGTSETTGAAATPGRQSAAVLIRRDDSGRFLAHGELNAAAVDLLLDTGATAIMLKHSDAEKAGVSLTGLAFDTPVETANGTAYAATVRLRTVAVGAVHADDVEALVLPAGSLNESLLGMNFLRRLTSYELKGDFLTLRQ